jgi:hypothetical protein
MSLWITYFYGKLLEKIRNENEKEEKPMKIGNRFPTANIRYDSKIILFSSSEEISGY